MALKLREVLRINFAATGILHFTVYTPRKSKSFAIALEGANEDFDVYGVFEAGAAIMEGLS